MNQSLCVTALSGRQYLRNLVPIEAGAGRSGRDLLASTWVGLLFGLDLIPAAFDVVRGLGVAIGEDLRMAAHQVVGGQGVRDIEAALFGCHLREEDGLHLEIPQNEAIMRDSFRNRRGSMTATA